MVFVSSLVSLGLVPSFSLLALWCFLSGGEVLLHKCRWLRPPPLASLLLSLCLLPQGSWYLRSPFFRCLDWVGGVVCVEFCTGIASGSYRCFFSLHCLATYVCASSCSSFFLSSCFPASRCLRVLSSCLFSLAFVFLDVACLFCSWLGLSSAGLCGSLFTCGALPDAPLFSAASVCSAPLGSSAALYGFASPLSSTPEAPCLPAVLLLGAPGFSAASSLTPFCAAPLASAAGLFGFPSASAGYFIAFVGSTPQPGSAQAYAPLSGTSTASSVLLYVSG